MSPAAAPLDDPARRDAYVTGIFDLIAPRYDRFTRWFSYGMDAAWKREAEGFIAQALRAPDARRSPIVVDLACGTGDLTLAAHHIAPAATVVGVDVSQAMLAEARVRGAQEPGIQLAGGDMTRLPFADSSADLVTAGYGLRNAPRLHEALDEIARVMQPGGTLVTLDFFLPSLRPWRHLFLGYLAAAGWLYGWLWHRRPDAYVYIPRSIRRFVSSSEFEEALRARGFRVTAVRRKLLGGVALHVARRGESAPEAGQG